MREFGCLGLFFFWVLVGGCMEVSVCSEESLNGEILSGDLYIKMTSAGDFPASIFFTLSLIFSRYCIWSAISDFFLSVSFFLLFI